MKVYVATAHYQAPTRDHVIGVYSTKEKADDAVTDDQTDAPAWTVTEFELDKTDYATD
jgi:hypothetical protein